MVRSARRLTLALAAASLALFAANPATADPVLVAPPGVAYYPPPSAGCYGPAPAVSYYAAPAVSYYAPAVSYYAAPAASYYYTPSVSYYAPPVSYYPAPGAVTTTRYGLFGRPRYSTTYYYP